MTTTTTATVGMLERYHDGRSDRKLHAIVDGKGVCDPSRVAVYTVPADLTVTVSCKKCLAKLAAGIVEAR